MKYHKGTNIKNMIENGVDAILIEKTPDYCLYKNEDVIIETDRDGYVTNMRTDLIDELFPTKII